MSYFKLQLLNKTGDAFNSSSNRVVTLTLLPRYYPTLLPSQALYTKGLSAKGSKVVTYYSLIYLFIYLYTLETTILPYYLTTLLPFWGAPWEC